MSHINKMSHSAWWLHRDGVTIPVPVRHIVTISNEPELFGLTHEYVSSIFLTHGESLGHEGLARQEIMKNLILNHGWIRVRYLPRNDICTIELARLDAQTKMVIQDFFTAVLMTQLSSQSDVIIYELTEITKIRGSLGDFKTILN